MILTLLLTLSTAAAPDWQAAFPADAVASYLPTDQAALMVVLAGPKVADAATAKEALAGAARTSTITRLVMTDEALGDASAISDQDAVKQAGSYATTVVVLRVFAPDATKPPLAVASVFTRSGSLVSSFTTTRGVPLSRNTQPLTVTNSTMDAVSSTLEEKKREPGNPRQPRGPREADEPSDAPTVRVKIAEKSASGLRPELHRIVRGSVGGYALTVDGFVCALPCDQEVTYPDMEYYIVGRDVTASESFRLSQYRSKGRTELEVTAGDAGTRTLGIVGLSLGTTGLLVGLPLTIAGVISANSPYGGGGGSMIGIGLVVSLLSGIVMGVSVPALLNSATRVTPVR